MALADRDPRRIVIRAAGKCIQAEGTEQKRKDECIARKLVEMLLGAGQSRSRLSLDRRGRDLDVLAFAPGCGSSQLACPRCPGSCLGKFHVELMDAGSRDVSECEGRIFNDCGVESVAGSVPGRKNTVGTVAI